MINVTTQITYDDLVRRAYNADTRDDLASKYQQALVSCRDEMSEKGLDWYRYIFLVDEDTGKLIVWID